MAYIVRVKNAGTTINFIGDDHYVLEDGGVVIEEPKEDIEWTSGTDGDVPVNIYYKFRKVIVTFSVEDSLRRLLYDKIGVLNDMLRQSLDFYLFGKATDKAEFEFAWDGANSSYFEILYGFVEQPKNVMSVDQIVNEPEPNLFRVKHVKMTLFCKPRITKISPITGDPTELATTNCHGTVYPGGSNVENTWEGTTLCNYVTVGGVALEGDMPLPSIIKIANGGVGNIGKVFIGKSLKTYTSDTDLIIELEDSESNIIWGGTHSGQSDTNFSNNAAELATIPTAEALLCYQSAPTIKEGIYRVFLLAGDRAFPKTTTFKVEFKPEDAAGVNQVGKVVVGEWVVPISYHARTGGAWMVDMGMFILPPNLQGIEQILGGSSHKYSIKIYGKSTSGSTQQVSFDRLMFMPIDSGFRVLDLHVGLGSSSELDEVMDDGWRGYTYIQNSADTNYSDSVDAFFSPIELTPKVVNRLTFLFEEYGPTARNVYATIKAGVEVYTVPSYKTGVPWAF